MKIERKLEIGKFSGAGRRRGNAAPFSLKIYCKWMCLFEAKKKLAREILFAEYKDQRFLSYLGYSWITIEFLITLNVISWFEKNNRFIEINIDTEEC